MDIDVIREVALRAVKEAGAILREGLEQARTIEFKGDKNIVTDVDRRSEEAIAALVRRELPGHSLVSEEGARLHGDSGYRWFVDPLDGTTNYVHGYPCFSVS
ncbi:MAG: inositol monophosphatase family protein, partial [Candidatus Methylomirabilis sp.]